MNEKSKRKNSPGYLLVVPLIVFIDQISKLQAASFAQVSCNTGIAFGLSPPNPIVVAVPIIVLFYLFYLLSQDQKPVRILAIALILGGGLSNLLDRLFIGCVRDFINFGVWPSFNLADVAISWGVLLIIYEFFAKRLFAKNEI